MTKDIDNITGLYFATIDNPYASHSFPFNLKKLGNYLKETGKDMKDLTIKEFEMFRVSEENQQQT